MDMTGVTSTSDEIAWAQVGKHLVKNKGDDYLVIRVKAVKGDVNAQMDCCFGLMTYYDPIRGGVGFDQITCNISMEEGRIWSYGREILNIDGFYLAPDEYVDLEINTKTGELNLIKNDNQIGIVF